MFARLAINWNADRRRVTLAPVVPASPNDRRSRPQPDPRERHRRPPLRCHWRLDPASGRLSCVWEVEETSAETGPRPLIARAGARALG
jgi:hypothetical protein